MKHSYVHKYENVIIRPVIEADLERIRVWRNTPDNTKFLSQIPYITPEMQREWYRRTLENDDLVFAIDEINGKNPHLVGSLSLYNIEKTKAEFGKLLIGDESAHGKNIGVHSLKALLFISFDILNLNEIYLHVFADNIAAIKVYERAGFSITSKRDLGNIIEYTMVIVENDFKKENCYGTQHE